MSQVDDRLLHNSFYCFKFTWNNPPSDAKDCLEAFQVEGLAYTRKTALTDQGLKPFHKVSALIGAFEICPTTNTPHIQGAVRFVDKIYWRQLQARFPGVWFGPADGKFINHVRYIQGPYESDDGIKKKPINPTFFCFGDLPRQGKRTDLSSLREAMMLGKPFTEICHEHFDTVMKFPSGTRLLYSTLKPAEYGRKVLIELRSWQKKLLSHLSTPYIPRQIIWIWSLSSTTGKTTFMQHVDSKYVVTTIQEFKDWNGLVHSFRKDTQVVHIDIPRAYTYADKTAETLLEILEKLSDHSAMSTTKYEGKRVYCDAHIVVTSNLPPPRAKLPNRFTEICLDNNLEEGEIINHITVSDPRYVFNVREIDRTSEFRHVTFKEEPAIPKVTLDAYKQRNYSHDNYIGQSMEASLEESPSESSRSSLGSRGDSNLDVNEEDIHIFGFEPARVSEAAGYPFVRQSTN